MLGNSQNLVEAKNFVSLQCFLDIQLSCHFVVLLICHIKDMYPYLVVMFHLIGNDLCKVSFLKY